MKFAAFDLWLGSFLVLFFELVCIRWVNSTVTISAYFSNIILISCFLGYGVGCLIKRRRFLLFYLPFLATFLVVLCNIFSTYRVSIGGTAEVFWQMAGRISWHVVLPILYVIVTLIFICLGQVVGRQLDLFSPLKAYSINLLGSLAGTVGFTIVSFSHLSPTIWFSVSFVGIVWLLRQRYVELVTGVLILALGVSIVHSQQQQSLWSPYYKIDVGGWTYPEKGNFLVAVNNDYHQLVLNLSSDAAKDIDYLQKWQLSYNFPYLIGAKSPRDILILGAGNGNDVAAALRNNANHVDAVELDPVIWKLGKDRHPEHPYADSRVKTHINDARNFLRDDNHRYDLIVMGWLDSHRLFSNLSNIRQDNFVYTVEAMRQAKQHLQDQGLLCLSFYVPNPWVGKKLFDLLTTAFGAPPRVFNLPSGGYEIPGQTFVTGLSQKPGLLEGLRIPVEFHEVTGDYLSQAPSELPIDDWPYLYYKDRILSADYQWTIITLSILSFCIVLAAAWEKRREFKYQEALPYFLLGAGFMTLETKNLTAVALAFGSTWIVNSIVICGILLMALGANYYVERNDQIRKQWYWLLLFVSIVINYFWHDGIVPGDPLLRGIVLCVVVSISFFFAAVIFSTTFKNAKSPSLALGINIFGGVVGGFAEYLNLIFGLKSLLVLALIFYGGACIFSSRPQRMQHT